MLKPSLAATAALLFAAPAAAGTIVVNADQSEPAPRAAWENIVAGFEQENPGIDVELNIYDRESYKRSIRNWLTGRAPDVVFWYVGNRMDQLVKPGLLAPVSAVFTDEVKGNYADAAMDLVTVDGEQYGVPYSYYNWGLYYRDDLLKQAGVNEAPRTWDELKAACGKLKTAGIAPVAIGSKDLWPTAGWFDYIDLRENGYDFHMSLMRGEVPYTDPRVRRVFELWGELLSEGCFQENHASVSWQESQALLYQGRAAMMLMGNFLTANFPDDIRPKMGLARFPLIREDVPLAEDAPMDSIHIPARAANKEEALKFLAYVAQPEVQAELNARVGQIPINRAASVKDDPFLQKGAAILNEAQSIAQFFDRDTSEDLATIGMKGFQEFMAKPDRLDQVLETLERARKRIYGAG